MKKSIKAKCINPKKTVQTSGRDKIEVEPENNINVDKEATSYSEYQRKPQSKSSRFSKSIKKPYRVSRISTRPPRRKKI